MYVLQREKRHNKNKEYNGEGADATYKFNYTIPGDVELMVSNNDFFWGTFASGTEKELAAGESQYIYFMYPDGAANTDSLEVAIEVSYTEVTEAELVYSVEAPYGTISNATLPLTFAANKDGVYTVTATRAEGAATDTTIEIEFVVTGEFEVGTEIGDIVVEAPAASWAYSVEVDSVWSLYTIEFTAEKAGTYMLTPAEGETNAWVDLWVYNPMFGEYDRAWDMIGDDVFTSPYVFELEAGESISFWVSSWSEMADVIDLEIKLAD